MMYKAYLAAVMQNVSDLFVIVLIRVERETVSLWLSRSHFLYLSCCRAAVEEQVLAQRRCVGPGFLSGRGPCG